MGIINVTPDSFSDGGCHQDSNSAIEYALRLVESGADIVDVGGESTRPGADAVSADMEMERVLPVIAGIRARSDVLISVDTAKASVAASALGQGAHIVNDVSALTMDPDMLSVVADTDAGIIIMHMRGIPKNMQTQDLACSDIVGLVKDTLQERLAVMKAVGIDLERVCVDPGIGFGKTAEQNLQLINRLDHLKALGRPVLLGVSRKSVLGQITGRGVRDREASTCAAHTLGVMRGAHVLRVHDVEAARDVVAVTNAVMNEGLS